LRLAHLRALADLDAAVDRVQVAVLPAGLGDDAAVDLADVLVGPGRARGQGDRQPQRQMQTVHRYLPPVAALPDSAAITPRLATIRTCLKSLDLPACIRLPAARTCRSGSPPA